MEFALNNSPELTMMEITKKLFNQDFLSNIVFNIEDKVMYAHSLELMKRSIVFQNQLKPMSDKLQSIKIDNTSYKSFYEFIRFIYTEECDMNIDNGLELFKLAASYKVVKLENQVLDYLLQRNVPLNIRLSLYSFCIMENYELPYNMIKNDIARNLSEVMELKEFIVLEPNVIEDILKLDCVDENIKEVQIFNGLIRWMNKFCEINKIDFKERKQKFETLLQLIRYTNMTMEDFRNSVLNNCDLFADSDICVMFKDPSPIPKPRKACEKKFDRRNIMNNNTKSETKFTVSKEVIFTGFRYGAGGNHEVKILVKNPSSNVVDVLKLNKKFKDDTIYKTVSLGVSLVLKPAMEYTVLISYDNGGYTCWCATYRATGILVNDPSGAVEITQPGTTMFELFFKDISAAETGGTTVQNIDSTKMDIVPKRLSANINDLENQSRSSTDETLAQNPEKLPSAIRSSNVEPLEEIQPCQEISPPSLPKLPSCSENTPMMAEPNQIADPPHNEADVKSPSNASTVKSTDGSVYSEPQQRAYASRQDTICSDTESINTNKPTINQITATAELPVPPTEVSSISPDEEKPKKKCWP